MNVLKPYQIKTIGEYHSLMDLPKPQHPLISVIKFEDIKPTGNNTPKNITNGFYSIALKKTFQTKMKYGQQEYDFTEGILAFIAPNQIGQRSRWISTFVSNFDFCSIFKGSSVLDPKHC